MITEFRTYAYLFYRRCKTNICLAEANLDRQGMPQLPLKDVDLRRADAGNTDPLKIQPGQVVEFVSYHCTLDVVPVAYYIL